MIVKLAWKNIWRNKTRSAVVITAIALGLLAGVFASAFVRGMLEQKIDSVVKMEYSDFQLHHPQYREERELLMLVDIKEQIITSLSTNDSVIASSSRVIASAMISSAYHTGAIMTYGVVPSQESATTGIKERIVEGAFLEGVKRNPICVSRLTADKYHLKLKSKVVLSMQDIDGEMVAASFRVAGIFDSKNSMYDKSHVYVLQKDLQNLLGIPAGSCHEIAVLLKEHAFAEMLAHRYQAIFPQLEVLPWLDLASGMRYMVEIMDVYTAILVGIILLALLFSVVNTMLMAILERVKEIGMLMAIGMSRGLVFSMIMLETFFLNLVGAPLGVLMAVGFIKYYGKVGIDLSGAAYEDFGFSSVVYPFLEFHSYVTISIMVVFMAFVASLFPARKALKLIPVEAIRNK